MPRRPTKKWFDACVAGVSSKGSAYEPNAVCGAVWWRKPMAERRAIAASEHRHGNWPRPVPFDPKTWQRELTELDLFIEHDSTMYTRKKPYLAWVREKLRAGKYDAARAPTQWLRWVTDGAKRYADVHGVDWHTMFPLPLREHLAKAVARHELGRVQRGEYD